MLKSWTSDISSIRTTLVIIPIIMPFFPSPFSRWKILVYYIERGFLVGLVVTQDGQKVAKSLDTIIASFVAIGGTAILLQICQPYLKVMKVHEIGGI